MRILVGVDGSDASRIACQFIRSRTWPIGTRIRLLAAVEPVVDWTGLAPVRHDTLDAEAALAVELEDRATEIRQAPVAVETVTKVGRAADWLVREAAETFADLIVVGSRGLGPLESALLGSVSTYLVDHAPCPVLVARSPSATRMLLATDGTKASRGIPRILAAWGPAFRGMPVEVLSVAPHDEFVTPWAQDGDQPRHDPDLQLHEGIARDVADEMMELGWHSAATARSGEPSRQIVDESRGWRADLIVTGSRGLGTFKRLVLGSVAHDVLHHARSSVLVVRGQVPASIRGLAVETVPTAVAG